MARKSVQAAQSATAKQSTVTRKPCRGRRKGPATTGKVVASPVQLLQQLLDRQAPASDQVQQQIHKATLAQLLRQLHAQQGMSEEPTGAHKYTIEAVQSSQFMTDLLQALLGAEEAMSEQQDPVDSLRDEAFQKEFSRACSQYTVATSYKALNASVLRVADKLQRVIVLVKDITDQLDTILDVADGLKQMQCGAESD